MKFDSEIWPWNSIQKFDPEIWPWNSIQKFDPGNSPWNLTLKFDSEIWLWYSTLNFDYEIAPWNLTPKFDPQYPHLVIYWHNIFQSELEEILLNSTDRLKMLKSEETILTSSDSISQLSQNRAAPSRPKRRKSRLLIDATPVKKEKQQIPPIPQLPPKPLANDFWDWIQKHTHYIPEPTQKYLTPFFRTFSIFFSSNLREKMANLQDMPSNRNIRGKIG